MGIGNTPARGDSVRAFFEDLCKEFPPVRPIRDEHIRDNDEILSYILMADVIRWVSGLYAEAKDGDLSKGDELVRVLEFLEAQHARTDDQGLKDVIVIELLEPLAHSTEPNRGMRRLLGPSLKEALRAMEAYRPDQRKILDVALKLYADERVTLGYVAETAWLPLAEVAEAAKVRGIPLRESATYELAHGQSPWHHKFRRNQKAVLVTDRYEASGFPRGSRVVIKDLWPVRPAYIVCLVEGANGLPFDPDPFAVDESDLSAVRLFRRK